MRVALHSTFAASKKEPFIDLLNRVHQAFLDAGLAQPSLRFTLSDAPIPGFVASVDRVLNRHPEMQRFLTDNSPLPGCPAARRLTNAASGEPVPFSVIQTITAGIPKSFPFHHAAVQLHAPAFGEILSAPHTASLIPGVMLTDSWWVTGRKRSLSAVAIVDEAAANKKPPALPEPVAALLSALGNAKRTTRTPLTPLEPRSPPLPPDAAAAIRSIVAGYTSRIHEIVDRAALPHDLPPAAEARRLSLGVVSGPRKPALVRAFKPLGYDCVAESGAFTLSRRTPSNHSVQLHLDVGTWSHEVTAIFQVLGAGFKANLPIPVAHRALGAIQYPIGDADRWQKIVENLAALVSELDRTLVPEIDQAAPPAASS